MDNINLIKYWVNSSDEDYDAMQVMYKNKKNTWTLFLGHLVIEKLLKGLYAKKGSKSIVGVEYLKSISISAFFMGKKFQVKKYWKTLILNNINKPITIIGNLWYLLMVDFLICH